MALRSSLPKSFLFEKVMVRLVSSTSLAAKQKKDTEGISTTNANNAGTDDVDGPSPPKMAGTTERKTSSSVEKQKQKASCPCVLRNQIPLVIRDLIRQDGIGSNLVVNGRVLPLVEVTELLHLPHKPQLAAEVDNDDDDDANKNKLPSKNSSPSVSEGQQEESVGSSLTISDTHLRDKQIAYDVIRHKNGLFLAAEGHLSRLLTTLKTALVSVLCEQKAEEEEKGSTKNEKEEQGGKQKDDKSKKDDVETAGGCYLSNNTSLMDSHDLQNVVNEVRHAMDTAMRCNPVLDTNVKVIVWHYLPPTTSSLKGQSNSLDASCDHNDHSSLCCCDETQEHPIDEMMNHKATSNTAIKQETKNNLVLYVGYAVYQIRSYYPPVEAYEQGVSLAMLHDCVRENPNAKIMPFHTRQRAIQRQKQQSVFEVLLVHPAPFYYVTEGSRSNFFIVNKKNQVVCSLNEDILIGVTLKVVLEICEKMKIHVIRRKITLFDFLKREKKNDDSGKGKGGVKDCSGEKGSREDEEGESSIAAIAMTGTSVGVLPIQKIKLNLEEAYSLPPEASKLSLSQDETLVFSSATHPLMRQLQQAYDSCMY